MINLKAAPQQFSLTDFEYVAAGAAVLGSGGGGSYSDALQLLRQLSMLPPFAVPVLPYDGASNACVMAMMGSPDAGETLQLADVEAAVTNSLQALSKATGAAMACVVPVEIGALNSLVPLIAGVINKGMWVVDGDGAGRAVPQLVETTYSGAAALGVSPAVIGNESQAAAGVQTTVLNVATTAQAEALARGVVSSGFGSIAGLAAWPSLAANQFALSGNYIKGTLSQAWMLGHYMKTASSPPSTQEIADAITQITGRGARPVLSNFYITQVDQSTSGGFDAGIVRLDNAPAQPDSTATHRLYNLNESLIMYSSASTVPDIIAPDSICYYSESTGLGFSNSQDDLNHYLNTGKAVSVIQVGAAAQLVGAAGVMAAFAALLQNIGYAGALPPN